ncbi:MAG: membrane dipeptidase [Dysgonamonadaceae bacterium]|jgi:microsomal dipeptidase-like Zn-dependent dipeptidase/gamma-glutamyl-gamma-aminobutyrate hydrolase PuuD|nr:membrane dipeptidase [Dysgonamonadaceae bacterium]
MRKIDIAFWVIALLLAPGRLRAQISTVTDLTAFYKLTDSCFLSAHKKNSPIIGISVQQYGNRGSSVSGTYINAVLKAGGTPILIPMTDNGFVIKNTVDQLDGLLMIGGEDVNPSFYGEAAREELGEVDSLRDVCDLMLVKMAADRNIPILGICRGEQLINVAFGGSLYQDIPSQHPSGINHLQKEPREIGTHDVSVFTGSTLSQIIGSGKFSVNSFHHQSVKEIAPGFRVSARANDSIVEAIEAVSGQIVAVQWHPEGFVWGGDRVMLKLFRHIVEKAETYKKAKEIHARHLSIDTHCDAPLEFRKKGFDIAHREANQVNIPKMREGRLDAAFFAAYIGQRGRDSDSLQMAIHKVSGIIDEIYAQVNMNTDLCAIARTAEDAERLKSEGKNAIFIGIENGYAIGKDLKMISKYKERGVLYMTLCHIKNNDICDTSNRNIAPEWDGLSPFGKKVVKEMNRTGMIVDVSHVSEKTFWDVLKITKKPVIASHSGVTALCDHDRNLTDEQLRALAKNGGVIQICAVDNYLRSDYKNSTIEDFMKHLDHAVKIAGIDHVGIGNDFDGGAGVPGLNGANDMINITVHLLERGYSEDDIAKILGGNFYRVLRQVQQ